MGNTKLGLLVFIIEKKEAWRRRGTNKILGGGIQAKANSLLEKARVQETFSLDHFLEKKSLGNL